MVALLALAWVPLTIHCRIESALSFSFLQCCPEDDASAASGDPCQENGCCAVETANYQSPRQEDLHVVILVTFLPDDDFVASPLVSPSQAQFIPASPTVAPPELPNIWQFLCRAARPI